MRSEAHVEKFTAIVDMMRAENYLTLAQRNQALSDVDDNLKWNYKNYGNFMIWLDGGTPTPAPPTTEAPGTTQDDSKTSEPTDAPTTSSPGRETTTDGSESVIVSLKVVLLCLFVKLLS